MDKKLEPFQVNEDVWMIPCYSNRESNIYQPITTPLKISEDMQNINFRQAWSKEEDKALENFINLRGTKAWALIAKEINNLFHDGKNFRKGKQCRERYFNHINPNLKKGNWTEQEDLYIIEMQSANGNKWSDIAKNLSGRNENQVKNRWKSLMNIKMKEKLCESPVQPIPIPISPATSFIHYKIDPGFSALAEIIQAQYFSQANDATPPFHLYFP